MRKLKEHEASEALSRQAAQVKSPIEADVESARHYSEDHRHKQSMNLGSLTNTSKKTICRLEAFRFQPPETPVNDGTDSEALATSRTPVMDDEASADTIVQDQNWDDFQKSRRTNQSLDLVNPLEATIALKHDLLTHSAKTDGEHHLNGKHKDSSSSPFAIDDFNQETLEDTFQAVGVGFNPHVSDDANHGNLIPDLDIQQRASSAASDFGSDPFDSDGAGCGDEFHRLPPVLLVNTLNSQPCQPTRVKSPTPKANLESVLPLSYRTPRKSPPTEQISINGCAFQSTTPDSRPSNEHAATQPLSPSPFMRPSFPKPVIPNSPISNLIPSTRILTCFRTAEYIRTISSPTATSGLLIELYALVTSSTRLGSNQCFTFADPFFPHRPPHLQGTYTTWQGIGLYEHDTQPFLQATTERGELCRAIVRPKRLARSYQASVTSSPVARKVAGEGESPGGGGGEASRASPLGAEVEVLNIWKAGWDDVEYVRGIVGA